MSISMPINLPIFYSEKLLTKPQNDDIILITEFIDKNTVNGKSNRLCPTESRRLMRGAGRISDEIHPGVTYRNGIYAELDYVGRSPL